MRIFIVHAHPEPTSFNGAMTRAAVEALGQAGHACEVSDLYAMGFDPVPSRRDFTRVMDSTRFRQQTEEEHASRHDGFAPALQAEMDKVAWCDALVFQFPITWMGLPAIMKGWVDRVFAVGRAYGGGRYFESGVFRGKRAMCSVTLGGLAHVYAEGGLYAPVRSILYPVNHGIFAFTGFTVIEPFAVYGPARIAAEERASYLARYRERIVALDSAPIAWPVPATPIG